MEENVLEINKYNQNYSESVQRLNDLVNEIDLTPLDQENESFVESAYENGELQMKDKSALSVATQQNKYIYQLEQEISFLRDQLGIIKRNIQDVIAENENLREDSKRTLSFMLKKEAAVISDEVNMDSKSEISSNEIWGKWQNELVRIRSLYQATSERLESQVNHFRSELIKKQEEIEELKSKFRSNRSDSFIDQQSQKVPNLCINCGNEGGVLFTSSSEVYSGTVRNLVKEKEELCHLLAKARMNLKEAEGREEDSHNQIKNSVLLVEQAHFEKTELEAENIYLKQNLRKEEERMTEIVAEYKENLKRERQLITEEWSQRLNSLKEKVGKMNEEHIEVKVHLEKTNFEKENIQKTLASTKYQVEALREKIVHVQHSTKMEINQLEAERHRFMENLTQQRNEKDQLKKMHEMEIESMQLKIDVIEKKLEATEKKLLESNEHCLNLSQTITALEKQANFHMLSKQNVERSHTDDVKSLARESELKEKHLISCLDALETEHVGKICSLDGIISSQNSIIKQLQEECHILTDKLEDVTKQAWLEKNELLEENNNLNSTLELTMGKLSALEENQKDFTQTEVMLRQMLMSSEVDLRQTSNQMRVS